MAGLSRLLVLLAACAFACGGDDGVGTDAALDTSTPVDSGIDAVPDAAPDAVPDATPDAVPDAAPDAVPDAASDATSDATGDAAPDAAPDAGLGRCGDWGEWICAGGGGECRATCGGLELDCFGAACECNLGGGLMTCPPPSGTDCDQCENLLASPCCR